MDSKSHPRQFNYAHNTEHISFVVSCIALPIVNSTFIAPHSSVGRSPAHRVIHTDTEISRCINRGARAAWCYTVTIRPQKREHQHTKISRCRYINRELFGTTATIRPQQ